MSWITASLEFDDQLLITAFQQLLESGSTVEIAVALIVTSLGVLLYALSEFHDPYAHVEHKTKPQDAKPKPSIELHPMQMKFMEDKEKQYCEYNSKGKGIRCIIDYMRESTPEHVTEILMEDAKYTENFVPFNMDLYKRQIDWLAEQGVKVGPEGEEQYKALSKAFRSMLDFAMRMEAEGNQDKTKHIFSMIRCLNC